jgi:hypothetical protein
MYGPRTDINLSFLDGRQLEQVAIGVRQVTFVFDENVRITAYSKFNYFDGRKKWMWTPVPRAVQIASRTLSLLGANVKSFEGREDGTLFLAFSNGQRLIFLDPSKEYESYDITRPGGTIVV